MLSRSLGPLDSIGRGGMDSDTKDVIGAAGAIGKVGTIGAAIVKVGAINESPRALAIIMSSSKISSSLWSRMLAPHIAHATVSGALMKVQTAHGHEPDEVGAGAGDASASCITNKKRATNASYCRTFLPGREGVKSKYYCSDHFGSMFQVLGSSALSSRNVQGANPHSEERRSRRAAVQTCEHSSSRARGGRRALSAEQSEIEHARSHKY